VDLALEDGDGAHAAIHGVLHPGLGLVGQGIDGVLPLAGEELVEKLGDVGGAEDLVDVGELQGLLRREVGGEDAARHALAAEELAGGARGAGGGGWGG